MRVKSCFGRGTLYKVRAPDSGGSAHADARAQKACVKTPRTQGAAKKGKMRIAVGFRFFSVFHMLSRTAEPANYDALASAIPAPLRSNIPASYDARVGERVKNPVTHARPQNHSHNMKWFTIW